MPNRKTGAQCLPSRDSLLSPRRSRASPRQREKSVFIEEIVRAVRDGPGTN